MRIPWHRFFKVGLRRLFAGTCFEVHDELDLSDQDQEIEAFETEVIKSWLQEIDLEKTPHGRDLIEQGEEQAELRIAERMIRVGKSNQEVADITGLSLEDVQDLRK